MQLSYKIGLHEKDLAILEIIQETCGVGKISKLGPEAIQFRVYSKEGLGKIINHFDNFPLLTKK